MSCNTIHPFWEKWGGTEDKSKCVMDNIPDLVDWIFCLGEGKKTILSLLETEIEVNEEEIEKIIWEILCACIDKEDSQQVAKAIAQQLPELVRGKRR